MEHTGVVGRRETVEYPDGDPGGLSERPGTLAFEQGARARSLHVFADDEHHTVLLPGV